MRIVPSLALVMVVGMCLSAVAQDSMDDGPKVRKARWCDGCKAFVAPQSLAERHRCPSCKTVARRVEVAEVRLFVCADCGRRTECPRECCGATVKASPVRGAVLFRCGSCGAYEPREGPCPTPACRKMGRALERAVELPREGPPEK